MQGLIHFYDEKLLVARNRDPGRLNRLPVGGLKV